MEQARFPKPGDFFAGRYRIESMLGKGGYAQVFRATQPELGRSVAVKVLSRGVVSDDDSTLDRDKTEEASRRFQREAQLVSQLRDPHTVTIYEHGMTDDGLLYIVFELIDGRSLKEVIYSEGPLAPDRVVKILRKVLSSLREAHGAGILHRDLKPSNIMVFEHLGQEDVKLVDFGVAKLAKEWIGRSGPVSELTREGSLIGTPRYMSPEQIRDGTAGPPSDIFSLGLVAYEMLTRTQANPANSPVAVLGRQLDSEPFLLPPELPIPPGLQHTVHGMMQKDAMKRFQSAAEVLKSLDHWQSDAGDDALTLVDFRPRKVLEDAKATPPAMHSDDSTPTIPDDDPTTIPEAPIPEDEATTQRDQPIPENSGPHQALRTVAPDRPPTEMMSQQEAPEETRSIGRTLALILMLATLGIGLGTAVYYASATDDDPASRSERNAPDDSRTDGVMAKESGLD